MAVNLKTYVYSKGTDSGLDTQFAAAAPYARTRLGQTHLFWKAGFRWYCIPLSRAQRIFRRLLPVHARLCCGGHHFMIEWLVLVLPDGTELEIYLGEDVQPKAEALLRALKETHPEIKYGKESIQCSENLQEKSSG